MRSKIYDSVIYWSKNTTTEIGPIPSRSLTILQWDWPRQIASVGYFLFHDLESEKQSADPAVSTKAWQVYDAIIAGTESTVTENRLREDHYWGANLGYRLHTMQLRAALMNDYNQPITYVTDFRRGFVPSGTFADVRAVMTRSLEPSPGPSSPGLTVDDGFSQHAGSGGNAQLYTFGYAKDWVQDILQASERLNGTPWPLEKAEYDVVADYLLDGIQWQVFKGQGDYFGQGRRSSLARRAAYANANEFLSDYLNLLVTTAGPSQLTRYAEAIDARDAWTSPPQQTLVGNRALWNHDFMLQRSADFYVSTKMNSTRSSGNEAGNGNNRNHYFMGDGATLIMRTGDEYLNARVGWDWHQLPGTTTESRTDALPLRNWNGSNTGRNDFAGVASNGETGIAAFVNDRYDENNSKYLYHAINSKKATFYFQNQFVALGSDINRVGPGQNMTVRTTLNQVEWRSDVVYDVGEGVQTLPLETWETQSLTFSSPAWFHQDGIGYVILPADGQTVNAFLQTRLSNNNWHSLDVKNAANDIQSVSMFQLAVDHGVNPTDEQYQYVVIPNVSAAEMPNLVEQMNVQIVANTETVQAVRNLTNDVTQIVFYEPATLTLPDGLSVSSDQPALIILTRPEGDLEVTVADPLHSTSLDHLTLTVTEHLQGQGVTWDESQGISTIVIELSNEVMLAGQSVTARFTVINDQSGFMAGENRNINTPLQHEVQQILFDTVTDHKVWTAQSETQSLAAEALLLATQGYSSTPGFVGKDKTNNKRPKGHSFPSDSEHRNLAITTSETDHSIFVDVPFETSDWLNNI